MLRRILGPVAAAALVAATGVLLVPAGTATAVPARAAAACPSASGVTAVVDFKELGGGVTAGCDGDGGGRPASEVFRDAGYTLSYSQAPGMNGFVCKVQGKPVDGDCAQTDAFWSLWWSDGTSGRWVFANQGVGTLDVPDGGYVAFAWHQGGGDAQPPGAAPAAHEEPEPTDRDDGNDGDDGGDNNGGDGGQGPRGQDGGGQDDGDAPSESDDPSETPGAGDATGGKRDGKAGTGDRKRDREKKSEAVTASPTDPSSTTTDVGDLVQGPPPEATADEAGSSLPTWIAIGLAVLVIGAAAAVPLIRRRAG